MNSLQIENWALRVIERVKSGQPNEDFLVELKREWPVQLDKAARRIAGHANAARGEKILWLIGVDERSNSVPGTVASIDLANWYPQIQSKFNGVSPSVVDLNIPVGDVTVVALLFETDRAPFVVKSAQGGGQVDREVPWREGTRVRSAYRTDLIKMLAPLQQLPTVEILPEVQFNANLGGMDQRGNARFSSLVFEADLYITPCDEKRVIIPFHKCRVDFEIAGSSTLVASNVELRNSGSNRESIIDSKCQIIANGPGRCTLTARSMRPDVAEGTKVRVVISLLPAGMEYPVILEHTLPYPTPK